MMKLIKTILALAFTLAATQALAAEGVSRSGFTTAIDNREPVDNITSLALDNAKVYYFTEIKGLKGQKITHRWEQNGEVQATLNFNIGGDRWRIWSSKNLAPEWQGQWQVMVVDEAGNVLSQDSFTYGESSSSEPQKTEQKTEPQQSSEQSTQSVDTQASDTQAANTQASDTQVANTSADKIAE